MEAKRENITLVLHEPKYGGNVGSVLRCAKNMGFPQIFVVGTKDLNREEMAMMATKEAAHLIDHIQYYDTLKEALGNFQYVVGTTARIGAGRGPIVTPREMAKKIVEVSQENKVALVFGSEDKGLANEDIRLCHLLVTIPTAEFKSLNLSHAVMIICYEIFIATEEQKYFSPKLATVSELEGMYNQIADLLKQIGFLNRQNPDYWMRHVRNFFSRTNLQSREVKIIRGICRQLMWYGKTNTPPWYRGVTSLPGVLKEEIKMERHET